MQSIASMITIIVKTQTTVLLRGRIPLDKNKELWTIKKRVADNNERYINKKIPAVYPKIRPQGNTPVGVDGFEPPTLCL